MVTTCPPKTIVKPTALGPVANTDTKLLIYGLFQKGRVLAQDGVVICMVTTRPPKTIVKPTALGPVANTDTKLLIYGLFQKGRVLAQDAVGNKIVDIHPTVLPCRIPEEGEYPILRQNSDLSK